ncbi:MAG: NAD(P)-binding domain-containing protein, partial [Phyllobacteriaceae bacterium]|nr:NAD(P)-binding domain-containing protein [Phyllobacteriaceae bacterium]
MNSATPENDLGHAVKQEGQSMGKPVVAILGTGLMGAPMARNLLRAGYSVRAWNRTIEKARPLAEDGAELLSRPAEAVAAADFVIVMVSNGTAVADLLFSQGV